MFKNSLFRILKWGVYSLILSLFFAGCRNDSKISEEQNNTDVTRENVPGIDSSTQREMNVGETSSEKTILAITANALQVVSRPSGNTTELPTGMEMDKLSEIVGNVLNTEIPQPQVNLECGAGPMTMLNWGNGLTLLFQKDRGSGAKMIFVGWSLGTAKNNANITTMAGIGVGSTRAQMESAYTIVVKKTTLGYEFSTVPDGLFGIFSGPSPNDSIEFMWSGSSCNFR